jgi:glucosamine-6-phosphate deaminase
MKPKHVAVRTFSDDVAASAAVAASYLQEHPNATFYLDLAAAGLTRIATPWLAGPCDWTEALQTKAVLWLAQRLRKPILRLTDEDYAENGLSELLDRHGGSSYQLNIDVFKRMMATITGWPGGKRRKRRVLIFSPHPDDDVICMGGPWPGLWGRATTCMSPTWSAAR